MAVIAFIEAEDVIEKILKHLGLWSSRPGPTPDGQSAAFITEPISIIQTRRSHLPITGFMWTPYTRRTSCHEPRNRNRDAAWKVIFVLFHAKSHLTPNLTPQFPSGSRWTIPGRNTPVHRNPRPSTCCASLPLTHKGRLPYIPAIGSKFLLSYL